MKTSQEIMEIGIEEPREEEETMQYSEFFKKKWCSEEEIREKLDYWIGSLDDDRVIRIIRRELLGD